MPRLSPSLLQKLTRTHSPLLPIILRETRDVRSAENELRWMKEHIEKLVPNTGEVVGRKRNQLLRRFCVRRGVWAEPLQYILGNEYFGPSGVEIRVERGVLVPRPETADLITHFTSLLLSNLHPPSLSPLRQTQQIAGNQRPLGILDLCTGSGCIPILLHSLLYPPSTPGGGSSERPCPRLSLPPKILGVDISSKAVSLACKNVRHNLNPKVGSLDVSAGGGVGFVQGDVFDLSSWAESASRFYSTTSDPREELEVDVVISNPPYISPREYLTTTARSVRRWEPKVALVPPATTTTTTTTSTPALGDNFYPHIAQFALDIRAKALLVEVGGDETQADRVRGVFASMWGGRGNTAVWRDWGGRGRGVVAWRGGEEEWEWLGEDMVKD
ncbi:S-adenosyl-L-methionine-dependent methyltransferase [Terfezia claveryi]|nr:S-adenosyl-L-methionine-dependent methyltransferase [Terfezia claveryi]